MLEGISTLMAKAQYQSSETSGGIASMGIYGKHVKLNDAQIDKTAKDFESMFVSQMLDQMFGESIGDEMFGDSQTHEIYKNLMLEQYGKEISSAGGIGIADYVKTELLRLQEV